MEQALVRAKIQVQDYEGQLEDLEERLAKAGNRNEDLIRQQIDWKSVKVKLVSRFVSLRLSWLKITR